MQFMSASLPPFTDFSGISFQRSADPWHGLLANITGNAQPFREKILLFGKKAKAAFDAMVPIFALGEHETEKLQVISPHDR